MHFQIGLLRLWVMALNCSLDLHSSVGLGRDNRASQGQLSGLLTQYSPTVKRLDLHFKLSEAQFSHPITFVRIEQDHVYKTLSTGVRPRKALHSWWTLTLLKE